MMLSTLSCSRTPRTCSLWEESKFVSCCQAVRDGNHDAIPQDHLPSHKAPAFRLVNTR